MLKWRIELRGPGRPSKKINLSPFLSRICLPDGRVADYTYNPFGRRIKKQVVSSSTWYLYTDEGLVGEYSASGYWLKSYGWKPHGMWGTDPLYLRDGTGLFFYHNDHLATPQRLSNATTGAIVWSTGYAAFGKANIDPMSTVENNLRFVGQYFDEESGLHYNWQRTYDPGASRYTQVDPIGFYAGDVNLYRYVRNEVLVSIDPNGLFVKGLLGTGGIGAGVMGDVAGGFVWDSAGNSGLIGSFSRSAGVQFGASAGGGVLFAPFADTIDFLEGRSRDLHIRFGAKITISIPIDDSGHFHIKNITLIGEYGFGSSICFGIGGTDSILHISPEEDRLKQQEVVKSCL